VDAVYFITVVRNIGCYAALQLESIAKTVQQILKTFKGYLCDVP
jgi:hypothetical protein